MSSPCSTRWCFTQNQKSLMLANLPPGWTADPPQRSRNTHLGTVLAMSTTSIAAMFEDYDGAQGKAYDEMFDADGLRPPYERLRTSLHDLTIPELAGRVEALQANY